MILFVLRKIDYDVCIIKYVMFYFFLNKFWDFFFVNMDI